MVAMKKGPEAVEESIATTLRAYIDAELADISAAWNDGIPLVALKQIFAGYREIVPEYPVIMVVSNNGDEIEDAAPYWALQEHHVDVTVICQSDDVHVLDRQVKRYLLAIWEVIKKHQNLDDSLGGQTGAKTARYGRSEFYKLEKSHMTMQAGAWEVIVRADQSV